MPDALTRLADAAAPGPWHVEQRAAAPRPLVLTDEDDVVCMAFPNDARLIVLAPDLARVASQLAEALGLARTYIALPDDDFWLAYVHQLDDAQAAYRELLDRAKEEA